VGVYGLNKKFQIYLLSAIGLGLALLAYCQTQIDRQVTLQSADLMQESRFLSSVVTIDHIRSENMNKVASVIERFNPGMDEKTKLAIATEISNASVKFENLDVDLICATITHESAFTWDPEIVSPKGAIGLMQVMPATGEFLAKMENIKWTNARRVLSDPVNNIRLGSRYLSSLIEMYEVDGGLAAYNGGGKRAAMWLARDRAHGVLYQETQNYVPAVLSLYKEFRAF